MSTSSIHMEEKTDAQALSSDCTDGVVVKMETAGEDSAYGISTDRTQGLEEIGSVSRKSATEGWTRASHSESARGRKLGQWGSEEQPGQLDDDCESFSERNPGYFDNNNVSTAVKTEPGVGSFDADSQSSDHKALLSTHLSKHKDCREIVRSLITQWKPNTDCQRPYTPSRIPEDTNEPGLSTSLQGHTEKIEKLEAIQDAETVGNSTIPPTTLCVSSSLYSKSILPEKSKRKRKLTNATNELHAKPSAASHFSAVETPVINAETDKCTSAHRNIKTKIQKPSSQQPPTNDQVISSSQMGTNSVVQQKPSSVKGPYVCGQCDASFTRYGRLAKHMLQHAGQRLHACDQCDATFIHSGSLNRHKLIHTGKKPFTCDHCEAAFTYASSLKTHMLQHTGERFTCEECKATFVTSSRLKSHMVTHTGERPYKCDQCEVTFTTSDSLRNHMMTKHIAPTMLFTCDHCEATFTHANNLRRHRLLHTGKKYSCDECGATFIYASKLKSHMLKHTGEKPYSCDDCEATFTMADSLRKHVLVKHTTHKPFACDQCEATFAVAHLLNAHRSTHSGHRPYACDQCEATFTRSSNLKSHQRIHTGERISCKLCSATFSQSSGLKRHMLLHTGERPYTCPYCKATFTWSSVLKSHMLRHTGQRPYACDQCEATFTRSSHLKKHMQTHTGDTSD